MLHDELLQRLGKTPREVLHRPLVEVFPETARQGIDRLCRKVFQTGEPQEVGRLPLTPAVNGTPAQECCQVMLHPIKNETGTVTGIVALGCTGGAIAAAAVPPGPLPSEGDPRELTELKQRYHQLFNNLPVALFEEDHSLMVPELQKLKTRHGNELTAYLNANEAEARRLMALVRITDANQAAVNLFEAESVEKLKQGLHIVFNGKSLPSFIDKIVAIASGDKHFHREYELETLRGRRIQCSVSFTLPETGYNRILVSRYDISQQKHTEQALRITREQLELTFNNVPADILLFDRNGLILFANERAALSRGFKSSADLRGKDSRAITERWRAVADVLDEDGVPLRPETAVLAQAYRTRQPREGIYQIHYKQSREVLWLLNSATPLLDESGGVSMVLFSSINITFQKNAEQKIRESEERFRAVFANASVGIAITDLEGYYLQVNEAYTRITGYSEEELKHVTFKEVTYHADRKKNLDQVYALVRGENPPFVCEKRYVRKDGGIVWMKIGVSLIRDEQGRPRNIVGLAENITQAQAVQEKLKESEERFRTLANSIPQLAWMTDARGRIYWYNQRWYDYTGAEAPDMKGQGWLKLVHPDMAAGVEERFLAAVAAGSDWEDTLLLRNREGTYRWFLSRAVPVRKPDGRLAGWFGTNTDITDQRNYEAALKERKDLLRIALEGGELGYFNYNPQSGALQWSARSKEFFGLPAEAEADQATFLQALHPEDRQKTMESLMDALRPESGGRYEAEYRIISLTDGRLRWIRSKGKVVFDEAGKPLRFTGVSQDITDQKIAEEKLKESEQRFRHLADQAPMWVWMADDQLNVTYTNQEFLDYLGLKHSSEVTAKLWELFTHPDDLPQVYHNYFEAVARQQPFTMEIRVLCAASGTYEWHLFKGVPRLEDNAIAGYIGTAINIHQQKTMMEQMEVLVAERTRELQRSNEDLQQFAHVASHDLKEPVRKIKTYTNFLEEEFNGRLTERERSFIDKVQSAADRMFFMIDGVLTYSTINALEQTYEPVDLNEVMKHIETDLEVAIQQKNATIRYDRLPVLEGAPVLLYQLFYNLVNNSLKFARAGTPPVITLTAVRTSRDGHDWACITVADNGIGFEQKYAERIFGTFTRLNTKDKYEGTGLGLALCKKIVERHGGTITAHARENEGAAFEILLPVKQISKKKEA
ncbi:PAS domain S-box protein [Paraflavisolibacter sp. H34]